MNISGIKCSLSVGVFAGVYENAYMAVPQSFFPLKLFFLLLFTEVPYPDMWELGHIAHYHPTLIKVPILETDSCCHVP